MTKRGHNALPPETLPVLSHYKEPLRPTETGFGYQGTVAYDKTEMYTQCHICGYFLKNLGIHIVKSHAMSVAEYKDTFEIARDTSLVAPKQRELYTRQWSNKTAEEREVHYQALAKGRRKMLEKRGRVGAIKGYHKKSLEQKNREGSCPDQLIDKILLLRTELGRTPTSREFRKFYGGYLYPIYRTFGSWGNALNIAGLVVEKRPGRVVYTKPMVIAMLRDFRDTHGREPFSKDVADGLLPSQYVFHRLFGSWSKAKTEAYRKETYARN